MGCSRSSSYFLGGGGVVRIVIFGEEFDFDFAARAGYLREDEEEPMVQKMDWHTGPEYSSGWKKIKIKNIPTRSCFARSWMIQEMVLATTRSR